MVDPAVNEPPQESICLLFQSWKYHHSCGAVFGPTSVCHQLPCLTLWHKAFANICQCSDRTTSTFAVANCRHVNCKICKCKLQLTGLYSEILWAENAWAMHGCNGGTVDTLHLSRKQSSLRLLGGHMRLTSNIVRLTHRITNRMHHISGIMWCNKRSNLYGTTFLNYKDLSICRIIPPQYKQHRTSRHIDLMPCHRTLRSSIFTVMLYHLNLYFWVLALKHGEQNPGLASSGKTKHGNEWVS